MVTACGAEPQPPASPDATPTQPPSSSTPSQQATGTAPSPSQPAQPSQTPALTGAPSPTVTPSSTPELGLLAGIRWAQATAASEFEPGDTISDAISLESTLIAAGTSPADGAAIWTSRDGLAWRRSADLPDAADSTIDDITVGPGGVVAVGSTDTGRGLVPAVWVSANGVAWESVDDPDLNAGEMAAVAGGPDGYVALGTDIETSDANVVWTSADGRDWTAPTTADAFGTQPSVSDVIRLPEMYLAFGARDEQAALWVSADGMAWDTAPDFPVVAGAVMTAAAHSASRTVVVGGDYADDTPLAVAWSSMDGLNWLPSIIIEPPATGEMIAVLPVAGGFIAVGEEGGGERGGQAAVWISRDGLSWQRQPDDPTFALARMTQILPAGTGLVVLGEAATDISGEDFGPAVWLGVAG